MSTNFDWQTEDEEGTWEPEPVSGERSPRQRRNWAFLLVLVFVVGVAGYLMVREVNKRAEVAQEQIKADVLAADGLARLAAEQRDQELFVTVLSGRDPRWTDTQQELLDRGFLFRGAATPLGLRPNGNPSIHQEVTLSPDLDEAVVTTEQPYAVTDPAGFTETVNLEQVTIYRLGSRNWLFSPPDDEFWGEWQTASADLTSVAYPARDAEFVQRFAAELEADVASFFIATGYAPGGRVFVRFGSDPDLLGQLADPEHVYANRDRFNLPAPSLVGLPLDEAGYALLYRGYARLIFAGLIGETVGWECCRQLAFFIPLADRILANGNLGEWSVSDEQYLDVLMPFTAQGLGQRLWLADDLEDLSLAEQTLAYLYVDYMLEQDVSAGDALEALVAPRNRGAPGTFNLWVEQATGVPFDEGAWQVFVREQIRAYQEQAWADAKLPDQDLVLACASSGDEEEWNIFRYRLSEQAWSPIRETSRGFTLLVGLPDDNGVMLLEDADVDFPTEIPITSLWYPDGREYQLSAESDDKIVFHFEQPRDPLNKYVVLWIFGNDGIGYGLLDNAACRDSGACHFESLPGYPVWTPDGQRLIVAQEDGVLLMRERNGESWVSLGTGASPFWLDAENYGFIGLVNRAVQLSRIDVETPAEIVSAGELEEALPEPIDEGELIIQSAITYPQVPGTIFIIAQDRRADRGHLFEVKVELDSLPAAEPEFAITYDGLVINPGLPPLHYLSADGQYLALGSSDGTSAIARLTVFDRTSGSTLFEAPLATELYFGTHDWAQATPWLVYLADNYIGLVRPSADGDVERYVILPEENIGFCSGVAWIDRE